MGIDLPSRSHASSGPLNSQSYLQYLLFMYQSYHLVNDMSIPIIQSFSENLRLIVSLLLIPSVLYPRSWVAARFVSVMAYVFFFCIHSNLILYHEISDIKYLVIQLLILTKALLTIVDGILDN